MGLATHAGVGSSRAFRLMVAAAVAATVLAIAAPAQAAPPEVGFTASTSNPTEGGASVNIDIELNALAPLAAPLQFTVEITGGDATASDHDFTSPTNLQFDIGDNLGATRTIEFAALDDVDDDDGETLELTIRHRAAVRSSLRSRFTPSPLPTMTTASRLGSLSGSSGFAEGNSGSTGRSVSVALTTAAALLAPQTVQVVRTSGSATSGVDFSFASPSLVTFPAGSVNGATQQVTVTVNGDTTPESNETVVLGLQSVSEGGSISGTTSHTLTIQNDDADAFSVGFSSGSSGFAEGNSGSTGRSVSVALTTAAALLAPQTVQVVRTSGSATSGVDFSFASPSLVTFPAGSVNGATQQVTVTVNGDTTPESNETVVLGLQSVSGGGSISGTTSHTLTIQNDDADAFSVGFSSGSSGFAEGNSGSTGRSVSVALTTAAALLAPQTVQVVRTSGSATSGVSISRLRRRRW